MVHFRIWYGQYVHQSKYSNFQRSYKFKTKISQIFISNPLKTVALMQLLKRKKWKQSEAFVHDMSYAIFI